jgi:hypothetical protein
VDCGCRGVACVRTGDGWCFSQIRDDTRGQYLLTYVSRSGRPRDELRKITVDVPGKRVNVRATSGYYPK